MAWLAGRTGRYEFLDGRIVAMASGSELHNDTQVNLLAALKRKLRGGPCKPNGPDLLVRTDAAGRRGRFPDASVTCSRESGRFPPGIKLTLAELYDGLEEMVATAAAAS